MFRTRTVLVLGAGASAELGYPLGSELLKRIEEDLDIKIEGFRTQRSGSEEILEAAVRIARREYGGDVNSLLHAGRKLVLSASQARSIDNAIDQIDDDPLVPLMGKLAIAQAISKPAKPLRFASTDYSGLVSITGDPKDTWLYWFSQALTTDLRATNSEMIFDNISVVTFNYDLSLEFYLPSILMRSYSLDLSDAHKLSRKLEIIHAYGSIKMDGSLNDSAEAGGNQPTSIEQMARNISTFTESANGERKERIQSVIHSADQIVFVGFGYHRQNMELLGNAGNKNCRVIGTIMGEPQPAFKIIKDSLKALVSPRDISQAPDARLANLTGAELLREYYLPITGGETTP